MGSDPVVPEAEKQVEPRPGSQQQYKPRAGCVSVLPLFGLVSLFTVAIIVLVLVISVLISQELQRESVRSLGVSEINEIERALSSHAFKAVEDRASADAIAFRLKLQGSGSTPAVWAHNDTISYFNETMVWGELAYPAIYRDDYIGGLCHYDGVTNYSNAELIARPKVLPGTFVAGAEYEIGYTTTISINGSLGEALYDLSETTSRETFELKVSNTPVVQWGQQHRAAEFAAAIASNQTYFWSPEPLTHAQAAGSFAQLPAPGYSLYLVADAPGADGSSSSKLIFHRHMSLINWVYRANTRSSSLRGDFILIDATTKAFFASGNAKEAVQYLTCYALGGALESSWIAKPLQRNPSSCALVQNSQVDRHKKSASELLEDVEASPLGVVSHTFVKDYAGGGLHIVGKRVRGTPNAPEMIILWTVTGDTAQDETDHNEELLVPGIVLIVFLIVVMVVPLFFSYKSFVKPLRHVSNCLSSMAVLDFSFQERDQHLLMDHFDENGNLKRRKRFIVREIDSLYTSLGSVTSSLQRAVPFLPTTGDNEDYSCQATNPLVMQSGEFGDAQGASEDQQNGKDEPRFPFNQPIPDVLSDINSSGSDSDASPKAMGNSSSSSNPSSKRLFELINTKMLVRRRSQSMMTGVAQSSSSGSTVPHDSVSMVDLALADVSGTDATDDMGLPVSVKVTTGDGGNLKTLLPGAAGGGGTKLQKATSNARAPMLLSTSDSSGASSLSQSLTTRSSRLPTTNELAQRDCVAASFVLVDPTPKTARVSAMEASAAFVQAAVDATMARKGYVVHMTPTTVISVWFSVVQPEVKAVNAAIAFHASLNARLPDLLQVLKSGSASVSGSASPKLDPWGSFPAAVGISSGFGEVGILGNPSKQSLVMSSALSRKVKIVADAALTCNSGILATQDVASKASHVGMFRLAEVVVFPTNVVSGCVQPASSPSGVGAKLTTRTKLYECVVIETNDDEWLYVLQQMEAQQAETQAHYDRAMDTFMAGEYAKSEEAFRMYLAAYQRSMDIILKKKKKVSSGTASPAIEEVSPSRDPFVGHKLRVMRSTNGMNEASRKDLHKRSFFAAGHRYGRIATDEGLVRYGIDATNTRVPEGNHSRQSPEPSGLGLRK